MIGALIDALREPGWRSRPSPMFSALEFGSRGVGPPGPGSCGCGLDPGSALPLFPLRPFKYRYAP